jgi:hypothetical protein
MTELTVRLEKLRFIIAELQFGFAISQAAPTTWDARLAARHVLVRANDFIAHSRQLRKLVKLRRSDKAFHKKREIYAAWFDEYIQTVRNWLTLNGTALTLCISAATWYGYSG